MTLRLKIAALADLIKRSHHFVAYTGAGISTSASIGDYASKAKNSLALRAKGPERKSGLSAEPTFAHHTLVALYRAGYLKHWIQQNHDGLPQKAGFPQAAINEIHGAWFDPSNPVVPMEGTLRSDLFQWLDEEIRQADLTLAVGTSLCGMNADRAVSAVGKRAMKRQQGLGAVIVGFQQTRLDDVAALRIYANIDEVMMLLAAELALDVKLQQYVPQFPPEALKEPHVFYVPYDSTGQPHRRRRTTLNLTLGAHIMLTAGPGKGFRGTVTAVPSSPLDHYTLTLPNTREGRDLGKGFGRYLFGTWMIEACINGSLPFMPVVNVPPAE
jgi:NAD-dependent SIR2 family protein deacetylase